MLGVSDGALFDVPESGRSSRDTCQSHITDFSTRRNYSHNSRSKPNELPLKEQYPLESCLGIQKMDGFPRIAHLSTSPGVSLDDLILPSEPEGAEPHAAFLNQEVIISEKLDGGCTCIHKNTVYARSFSQPASHPSFSVIKSRILPLLEGQELSDELYLFGENVTAIHSIAYQGLPSCFFLFSVYGPLSGSEDERPVWWPFDDVVELASRLGLEMVPVLFRGTFESSKQLDDWISQALNKGSTFGGDVEGFVVRRAGSLTVRKDTGQFEGMAKWVRQGHVQTGPDWRRTWKKQNLVY